MRFVIGKKNAKTFSDLELDEGEAFGNKLGKKQTGEKTHSAILNSYKYQQELPQQS